MTTSIKPAPVRSYIDALRIFMLGAANPLQPESIAMVLDKHGNGGVLTIVSGTIEADAIVSVVDCMSRAAERVPGAFALVVATVRPGRTMMPSDVDLWHEINVLAATRGILLLDWLIITEQGMLSPRQLVGLDRWNELTDAE